MREDGEAEMLKLPGLVEMVPELYIVPRDACRVALPADKARAIPMLLISMTGGLLDDQCTAAVKSC